MRIAAVVGLTAFAVCGWLTRAASSDDKRPKASAGVQHDFGTHIVAVRTSSTKTKGQFGFTEGYLEKVQVRRLGDRSFLVGQIPGRKGENSPYAGVTIWIPLSAVLELDEYESVEAAERLFKQLPKLQAPGPGAQKQADPAAAPDRPRD
jgi:hypothetical protein